MNQIIRFRLYEPEPNEVVKLSKQRIHPVFLVSLVALFFMSVALCSYHYLDDLISKAERARIFNQEIKILSTQKITAISGGTEELTYIANEPQLILQTLTLLQSIPFPVTTLTKYERNEIMIEGKIASSSKFFQKMNKLQLSGNFGKTTVLYQEKVDNTISFGIKTYIIFEDKFVDLKKLKEMSVPPYLRAKHITEIKELASQVKLDELTFELVELTESDQWEQYRFVIKSNTSLKNLKDFIQKLGTLNTLVGIERLGIKLEDEAFLTEEASVSFSLYLGLYRIKEDEQIS